VITVLAQPLLVYVGGMKKEEARQQLHEIVEQMESIEYQEKGENIFEQYLGKVDQKEE
jgi:polyhydroxyalkanoate synthesis regulator phasin